MKTTLNTSGVLLPDLERHYARGLTCQWSILDLDTEWIAAALLEDGDFIDIDRLQDDGRSTPRNIPDAFNLFNHDILNSYSQIH